MKKWSKITCVALFVIAACCSCDEKLNEEPPVNAGYKTSIRVPDPEPLTPEDQALIDAQQKEYDENKSQK